MATPADCSMMTHGSRADGIDCRASWVKRLVLLASRRSTTGVSPLTVTDSCTEEISIEALIWTLAPISTRTASRIRVLKPVSSKRTE